MDKSDLVYKPATGRCASCRWLSSFGRFYPVGPPSVDYDCAKRHTNGVPHVPECRDYEREPGAD